MRRVDEQTFHPAEAITGLILAGGRAQRMGGQDKGLVDLDGRTLVEHVIARFAPQVGALLISANRHQTRYATLGAAIVADVLPDYPGPLAGILSALQITTTPWLAVVPCDSPFLPCDLVARLAQVALPANAIAIARAGAALQPVFALMPTRLQYTLAAFLASGRRKMTDWFEEHPWLAVDFEDDSAAFTNINTEAERTDALRRLSLQEA